MPIKNVSVLWEIYKQLFKRIFRAFSVIFCVSLFFCKHDLFSKDCKQQYCHKLLSYIQAYIHTYMVIYTRDTEKYY